MGSDNSLLRVFLHNLERFFHYGAPMRTLVISLTIASLVFTSCHRHGVRGSGTEKSEQRSLSEFTGVEISGMFSAKIRCGESPGITVSGDDNLIPLVKTEVRDSRLLVYVIQDIDPRTDLSVDITTPGVSSVSVSGLSSVELAKVQGKRLTLVLSGAGSMNAEGSVDNADLVITGAGRITTQKLAARNLGITMSGAGKADVFATDTLNVTISGAGSVNYYGNPREVTKSISGVGFVTKKGGSDS